MAEELEVRQQTISEWETNTHTPHRPTQKVLTHCSPSARASPIKPMQSLPSQKRQSRIDRYTPYVL